MTDNITQPADVRIHYCKSQKHTGKPIMVNELGKDEYNTDNIVYNNVNIRVKFNNSIGKEKSRGATSILEVWKSKPLEDNKTLEFKVIKTRNNWEEGMDTAYTHKCYSCGEPFRNDIDRYKWRLSTKSIYWHNGSFWTEQCKGCVKEQCVTWKDSMDKILDMVSDEESTE
jgi:hypothetical protein